MWYKAFVRRLREEMFVLTKAKKEKGRAVAGWYNCLIAGASPS